MASEELNYQARTVAAARRLFERAKASPQAGLEEAASWLSSDDRNRVVGGRWARAVALFELGQNDAALEEFDQAIEAGSNLLNNWVAISMAAAESAAGNTVTAGKRLQSLLDVEDDLIVAYAASQLGMILLHQGQMLESVELLDRAISMFRRWPEEQAGLARVLNNAAYCSLILGRIRDAETYLTEGEEYARATSQDLLLAGMEQNLAYAQMCLGDVPAALNGYSRSLDRYRKLGQTSRNLVTLYDDMAEAFRLAGLGRDALKYARLSLWVARQGTNVEKLADAEFRRAQCLLDLGHWDAAIGSAQAAAERYREAERTLWSDRSDLLALEAAAHLGPTDALSAHDLVSRVPTVATELEAAGWTREAMAARNMAARALLDGGSEVKAASILEASSDRSATDPVSRADVAGPSWRLHRPEQLMERLELLYRDALLAQLHDRSPGPILQEVRGVLAGHQARLADPELRAGVSKLALRFRTLALDVVIDSRSTPLEVLEVEEQWRNASRPLQPTFTPQGGVQADLMSRLRLLCRQRLDRVERDEQLEEEIAVLEAEIRSHSLASATAAATVTELVDLEPIHRWLREHTGVLIELLEHRGRLLIIGLDPAKEGFGSMHAVEDIVALRAQSARIVATMSRLLRSGRRSKATDTAWQAIQDDCLQLGSVLIPCTIEDGRPLVVSPTLGLNALPWSLMTGCRGVVSLTPGVSSWPADDPEVDRTAAGVFVGPGLSAAHDETLAFEVVMGTARTIAGPAATARGLLELLQSCSILHVAAHSSFRADSIMMSSIEVADGPVSVYELGGVGRTPGLVVLAACEAGRTAGATSEWLGIAPELLRWGTECLVAPFHPIVDDDAANVMASLYGNIEGRSVAGALAQAQTDLRDAPPRLQASSHAFAAIGRGSIRLRMADLEPQR